MQYTKPNVLSSLKASSAIQVGAFGHGKGNMTAQDNPTNSHIRSTSGVYPADE
jgi:hypothetical protein